MPEGPEVYRIAQRLRDTIGESAALQKISITRDGEIQTLNALVERVITKGKRIIIILDSQKSVMLTFALTGTLEYNHCEEDTTYSSIADLSFITAKSKNITVSLRDPQKLADILVDQTRTLIGLLPEGFDPLHTISGMCEWLSICQEHPGQLVANFLVNQNIIAGIGNRYRSEIMHVSHIPPDSRVRDLTVEQKQRMLINIYRVLKSAARGEYTYTVFGRKETISGDRPVKRVEVAKGVLIWTTTAASSKHHISQDEDKKPKRRSSSPTPSVEPKNSFSRRTES